ncbi:MAG: FAD-binding oxidoreductase, partial [Gammaproteobacteria bacterium]|nr:FAD-binding oxidoreductase [Gammaproteobacteria bacterium]
MSNAPQRADAVVCGAGVAGIGAAYFLSLHDDFKRIVIIDERPPLTLTSDKSTECYRNWWPGPGPEMVTFMDRSIDLLEEFSDRTNNRIGLNRRGYLFASADPNNREAFVDESLARSALGIGETRVHSNSAHRYPPAHMTNVDKSLRGADVFTNAALIQEQFPYLPADTQAVIHARRCGWLSAQQLGMLMLEEAKERGVEVVMASLKGIETQTGAVSAVRLESAQGEHEITTSTVINAAGPMFRAVGAMANVDIPVTCEGHVKIAFADTKNAMARETPLLIWVDPVELGWTADQRNDLAADPELKYLTQQFPAGVHGRPEG